MTPALDPATPEEFGPYVVYERLGLGGMATVYRAKKQGIAGYERGVALKRMLSHLAEDAGFVESFIREAKVASLLVHPNIAQVYDFGRFNGVYYIAMELVGGFDLRKLLRYANRCNEPIPLPVVLSILTELCDALEYAHTFVDEHGTPLGIVHRDVSPSNLIVAQTGHLKVIDFGIAKASSRQLHTDSGQVKGKLGYMSPEAALGMAIGPASDVFSAGVVAWELITASPLFSARTDYETMRRIREAEILPPSRHNPTCPPQLDQLVLAALDREADTRLPTAGRFRRGLEDIAARYGVRVSARDVAEWIQQFVQPQDTWARANSNSGRIPMPEEAATSNLHQRRPVRLDTPMLIRTAEDAQLAAEIWGDDLPTSAGVQPPSADFSISMGSPPIVMAPHASGPVLAPPPPAVAPSRSRATPITIGVLLATAMGLGGYLLWQRSSHRATAQDPGPSAALLPATATASLRFVIQPEGSTIEIGGKEVSHDSHFETALEPGVYSISVRQDGYKRWVNSITLRDGERQNVNVALERGLAHVAIESTPPGLPIELDSKPTAYRTPARFDTVSGVHQIKITGATGVWSEEFTANVDATHTFAAELGTRPTSKVKPRTPTATAQVRDREPVARPPDPVPEVVVVTPKVDPVPVPITQPIVPPIKPVDPTKPARTPVVAANAVTKQSGEIPTIKVRGGSDGNGDVLVKMCIDEQGRVASVKVMKSTADIATDLQTALKAWRYKPYLNKDQQPSPVCFPLSLRVVVKRAD
ncbi:MAG: protein kinase [Deltaproteobacteria bacterium]|nr:protein kinase [Deltaproteobacteria bacterium]